MAENQTGWQRLSLMRHAESGLAPAGMSDIDRSLTGNGRAAAKALGERLAKERLQPGQILASDSQRTLETARSLLAGAKCRRPILLLPELYDSSPDTIMEVIAGFAYPFAAHVLVLAHNPGITQAAEFLASGSAAVGPAIKGFPPGTCATFTVQASEWSRMRPENVTLERVLYPQDYS